MDPSNCNGAAGTQTPNRDGHHVSSTSEIQPISRSELEDRDLESQLTRHADRSFSHYFGLSAPVSAKLEDIEEDLAESEDEETAGSSASTYHRSASVTLNCCFALYTDIRT
jgi:hypothetical protein